MVKFLDKKVALANNEMIFQPVTKSGTETFSVWDNVEKKYFREGSKISIEAGPTEVTKYIKLSDNDKKRYTRNSKVVREIIFNGEKYLFPFPTSANEKLVSCMETVESVGANPLDFQYKLQRDFNAAEPILTKYDVVSLGKKQASLPEPEIDLEDDVVVPNEIELQYLNAIAKKYPDYANRSPSVWAELISKRLTIPIARATELVNTVLYK